MILGIGHDVVDIAAFAQQIEQPGTTMRQLFSVREWRQAQQRSVQKSDSQILHLAGKWAAKESVIKAWCAAIPSVSLPYSIERTPWSSIEILSDARGIPHIHVGEQVQDQLYQTIEQEIQAKLSHECSIAQQSLEWHCSISHDGPIASAVVIFELRKNCDAR